MRRRLGGRTDCAGRHPFIGAREIGGQGGARLGHCREIDSRYLITYSVDEQIETTATGACLARLSRAGAFPRTSLERAP